MRRIILILQFCFIEQIFSSCPWSYPHRNGESCCSRIPESHAAVKAAFTGNVQTITKCYKWGPPLSTSRCGASFGADCGRDHCCSASGWCGGSDGHCLCSSCTDFRVAPSSTQSSITTEVTNTEVECQAKNNVCDEMLCYVSRWAYSKMGIHTAWTRCCDDLECSHSEVVAAVSAVYKQYHSQFGQCNFRDTAELISINTTIGNDCCENLEVTGLFRSISNGNYNFKKMVNHRPMYQSTSGKYAIWFDGQLITSVTRPSWIIGFATDLDAGKITSGFAHSNNAAPCPHFDNAPTEYAFGNIWSTNSNLAVTCLDCKKIGEIDVRSCPNTHPYSFLNGRSCCRSGFECEGKTVLEWNIDSSETWSEGIFGITAFDDNNKIVYKRRPSFTKFDESDIIAVDNIKTIRINTNSADGWLGLINVKRDGVNQRFECVNCLSSSTSTELARVYLDQDNTPYGSPGTAHCDTMCIFKRSLTEYEVIAHTSRCCHQNDSIDCKNRIGCYNSRELQSVQCPVDHPFVYFGGRFCCKYAHTSNQHPISKHSETCHANAFRPCSHHSNCKNHQSVSADLSALKLQETWVGLVPCDATHGTFQCQRTMMVGISRSDESSSGTSTEVRAMSALEVAMGFEVGGELWGGKVTGEIRQQFEHESTSGFTWSTTHSETFVNEHTDTFTIIVPKGEVLTLCHLVADFGHLRIKTNFVKPVPGLDCSAAN